MIFLDVVINGESYPFLFDTGANITVINEDILLNKDVHYLKDRLRCGGNAGKIITDVKVGKIDKLQFGEVIIADKEVAILPSEKLTFIVDDSGKKMKISGFLGLDIIHNFKWTINSLDKTIRLEKPKFKECQKNLFYDVQLTIMLEYNDEQLYFGFDSGNTESILGIRMYDRIVSKNEKTDSFTGVDGTIEKTVYDVEEFKFKIENKEVNLKHIPMIRKDVYISKKFQSMGLLASDIVATKSWVIDFLNCHFEILD